MFALKVPTHAVDLTPDATLTLTVTNALTDPDHTARSYTFDTTAPHSPNNDHLFRHAYRLDAKQKTKLTATLDIEGTLFQRGKVVLKDITADTYSLAYQSDNRAILDELGDKISTYAQENITLFQAAFTPYLINFHNYGRDPVAASIQVRGQLFTVTGLYAYTDQQDGTLYTNAPEKLEELFDLISTEFGADCGSINADGQLILTRFLPSEIQPSAHTVATPLGGEAAAQHQGIIANIQARMQDPESDVLFPVIDCPTAYENNPLFTSYHLLNRVNFEGNILIENDWTTEKDSFNNAIVPMFRVRYVLRKIATRLKLTLAGTWWNHPESQKLFLPNTVTLDNTVERTVTVIENGVIKQQVQYFNQHKSTITPGEHLPDMTAKEFLQELAEQCGFCIKMKQGKLYLNRFKELRNAKPRNFTTKLATDSLRRNIINEGITIRHSYPKEAPTPVGDFAPLSIGEGKTNVALNFAPFPSIYWGLFVNIPQYWGKINERPKVLMLYRGVQPTKGVPAATYCYATALNVDSTDAPINGAWSLAINGAMGIYQEHLKGIAELASAPEASALFYLSPEDVVAFERGAYSSLRADTPNGQLRAIITEMRLKLRADDIQEFYEVDVTMKVI